MLFHDVIMNHSRRKQKPCQTVGSIEKEFLQLASEIQMYHPEVLKDKQKFLDHVYTNMKAIIKSMSNQRV